MNDKPFQTILVGVFAFLTIAGFIAFSMFRGGEDEQDVVGNVTIWGTVDQVVMREVISTLTKQVLPDNFVGSIQYQRLNPETYNDDIVEALAAGNGPDIMLLSHTDILRQLNKIYVVPYSTYPERTFKDKYIEGAEIFLNNNGVVGFPFLIDPMIMYWNRDILSREAVVSPPEYWDEFFELSPKITKQDQAANILQATVAFGEYVNVTNAKGILSSLIMQAGDPIVGYNKKTNQYYVGLEEVSENDVPAESAIRFYNEFSNPIKAVYSWNRALPESRRAFLSGDLAFYFGYASELEDIRRSNPNLNFDIASLPQIRDGENNVVYGNIQTLAVSKASPNINGAFRIAALLTSPQTLQILQQQTGLPPITRELLKNIPTDDVGPVFYESAIITRAWLEPDSRRVDTVLREMIESISSGQLSARAAIREAAAALRLLF